MFWLGLAWTKWLMWGAIYRKTQRRRERKREVVHVCELRLCWLLQGMAFNVFLCERRLNMYFCRVLRRRSSTQSKRQQWGCCFDYSLIFFTHHARHAFVSHAIIAICYAEQTVKAQSNTSTDPCKFRFQVRKKVISSVWWYTNNYEWTNYKMRELTSFHPSTNVLRIMLLVGPDGNSDPRISV